MEGLRSNMRTGDPTAPRVSVEDVLACQIGEWYPLLKKVSPPTRLVVLSRPFCDYLLEDGIILPPGCQAPRAQNYSTEGGDGGESDGWSSYSEDETGEEEEEAEGVLDGADSAQPAFEEEIEAIEAAIATLGGQVLPKLNWSTPRDAKWINAGENLMCVSCSDVILILKSSDFAVHDLCHAFDCCDEEDDAPPTIGVRRPADGRPEQVTLALRKWFDLRSSLEFRCFVREGGLIAVCQRDCSAKYDFLLEIQPLILETLKTFFSQEMQEKMAHLKSFVFDAYIRQSDWRVFLIDVNPYGGLTQPLLFQWPDFQDLSPDEPELRLVSEAASMRPGEAMYSRLPADLRDVGSEGAIDDFVRVMREMGGPP